MARGGSRVEKLQGERVVCPVVNGRVYRRLPTIKLKKWSRVDWIAVYGLCI